MGVLQTNTKVVLPVMYVGGLVTGAHIVILTQRGDVEARSIWGENDCVKWLCSAKVQKQEVYQGSGGFGRLLWELRSEYRLKGFEMRTEL